MVHIDPYFVQVRPENSNFRVLYQYFSDPLQHNLLMLIESPNLYNWKSGVLKESVKKGKFETKIFLSDNVE